MTPEIALTLAIIVGALIVFGTEKAAGGCCSSSGTANSWSDRSCWSKGDLCWVSNSAVITVWAVYIVSGGLFKTGVADILGKFILRLSGNNEPR